MAWKYTLRKRRRMDSGGDVLVLICLLRELLPINSLAVFSSSSSK